MIVILLQHTLCMHKVRVFVRLEKPTKRIFHYLATCRDTYFFSSLL